MIVVQQACPNLAAAIEEGAPWTDLRELVEQYVAESRKQIDAPDCAILGCTHYPLVSELFVHALGGSVPVIDQPHATATALKTYLARHPEYDAGNNGRRIFLSTGFAVDALPLIEKFWGERLSFQSA